MYKQVSLGEIFIDFMDSSTISDNIIHNNSRGIYLKALANSNKIYSNTITDNIRGIVILGGNFNIIKRNNIVKNEKGIHMNYFQTELTHHPMLNFILKNNFLLNNEDVSLNYYDSKTSYFNFWWNDYWNEPRFLPKLIVSEVGFMIDWHPALFPNKI